MTALAINRPLTRCKRSQLPGGGAAFTGRAAISNDLMIRLLQIDRYLELIDYGSFVACYRKVKIKGSPSEDELVYQFTLKYPPGDWLIDCLNEADQWKKLTPEKSAQKRLARMRDIGEVREEQAINQITEMTEAFRPDIGRYFMRNRKHFDFGGKQ